MRSRHGALVVLAIVATLVLPAAAGAAAKPTAKQAAFLSWANKIRHDLAPCVAGSEDTEIELSTILSKGSSVGQGDFVSLATAAKNGAPLCAIVSNNGILNINSTSPPSGYPSLKSVTSDLQIWADREDQQVIIDTGKVATTNGNSTDAAANLLSDSQKSDQDAAQINAEVKAAAHRAGVKNWKGLGLVIWGLQSKS